MNLTSVRIYPPRCVARRVREICYAMIGLILASSVFAAPLSVDTTNPRYFTDGNKIVFLVGSHTWLNLQDSSAYAAFDYTSYLDLLQSQNHNFIRLWNLDWSYGRLIDPPTGYFSPTPFSRVTGHGNSADGGLKFDLSLLDQAYFDRLRARVIAAGERGIYVSVMLFDGWWIDGGSSTELASNWNNHFYNPANNINGLSMQKSDVYTLNNASWVALMDAYARKAVDTVNNLDNVLYEISNEAPVASKDWQYHMVNLIKNYEAGLPKQHPVGITSFSYPSGAESNNPHLYASAADWISLSGPVNYTNSVPATNPSKVSILDTDHVWGIDPVGDDSPWVWKSLTRGHNPIYMDPYGYVLASPPDGNIRSAMGWALALADKINLKHMIPSDGIASTGYALAHINRQYLVYQPANSSFTVNLPARTFNYEWINPFTGNTTHAGSFDASAGNNMFTLPNGYGNGALLRLFVPVTPLSAISRKTHGSAGTRDIPLPLTGKAGIESRSGGDSETHQIILTFPTPISFASASVTTGSGDVNSSSHTGGEVIIELTGVNNAQTIALTLFQVNDGFVSNDFSLPISLLAGDTTADGFVNSADISQTKASSGQPVTDANCRQDVTLDDSINSADISFVKSKSGTALPSSVRAGRRGPAATKSSRLP